MVEHAVAAGAAAVLVAIGTAAAAGTAPITVTGGLIFFFGAAILTVDFDYMEMVKAERAEAAAKEAAEQPPPIDIPPDPEPVDDGCFAEGTVVALADNRHVPIEQIAVGDVVASRQEWSLEDCSGGVTRTWKHEQKRTVDILLDTGDRVRTTAPHRFFTLEQGIVPASELSVGNRLRTLDGSAREIVAIEPGPTNMTVYNLTVAGSHTYFVGDAAVWVHNEKKTQPDDPPPPDPDPDPDPPGDPDPGGGGGGAPAPA